MTRFAFGCALSLTLLAMQATAQAATITVTGTGDTIEVDGLVTLREAITSANNNANINADVVAVGAYGTGTNPDTINFAIAGAGVRTIIQTSALPTITGSTVINGYTQPGSSPNTLAVGDDSVHLIELNGNGLVDEAMTISAGLSTVRGLIVNRFGGNAINLQGGSGNTLEGNWMGVSATGATLMANGRDIFVENSSNNLIGGTAPAARNVLAGSSGNGALTLFTGGGATIQGNYVGVNAQGTAALGSGGMDIATGGNLIGGTTPGAGNVIGGSRTLNIGVGVAIASNNIIQGNFIGTNAAGTAPLGTTGISLAGAGTDNNTIGGTAAAGNLISGNTGNGGIVISAGSGNMIRGNRIGSPDGTPLVSSGPGVGISGGNNTTVGGVNAGEGNVIAFNSGDGVSVSSSVSTGNSILRNSIHSNIGLGIDLSDDGVTANDSCDADTGTNNLQNYPVITSALSSGGSTTVQGTLNSTANTTFRIEFFSSAACDSSGNGEGQTFLGFTTVTTNGTCSANINATLPVAGGAVVTATATDPNGNTSEFSGCEQVNGGPTPTPTPSATPTATPSQLLNISTRMDVQTGDNVLIGGFIITGTDPKRVIIRGIGPSLSGQGLTGVLPDPTLELHGAVSINNDNWRDTQEAEIQATGIPPSNDLESAIVASLEPGAYTAILAGKENTTGIGLVEVYDLDQSASSKLANISTRGFVETGDNVMIGGFIAGPADTGATRVLIRSIGPSLSNAGIQDALQDPTLELHDGSGALIAMNDNWRDTQEAEIIATEIPPTDDRESAILQTLAPGNYTAIVRGRDNTTGVALVEAYNLQ